MPKGKCNCSGGGAERTISITESPNAAFTDGDTRWSSWRAGIGQKEHQYYTQVTTPWAGLYLGFVMVYDAVSNETEQRMHCKLIYSLDLKSWVREPSQFAIEWQ